jgi:PIN domain nuclease of toxin-antitoxin system
MTYLLDTHIFLWTLFQPKKLTPEAIDIIKKPENSIYISTITFWEISLKYSLKKLELEGVLPENMPQFAVKMNYFTLAFSAEDAATYYQLPRHSHKDPFDRMIIWQAIRNKMVLISKDRKMPEYKKHGLSLLA